MRRLALALAGVFLAVATARAQEEPLAKLIDRARGDGRDPFRATTAEEETAFAGLCEHLARAATTRGSAVVASATVAAQRLGFELVELGGKDPLVLLREAQDRRRGGGVYVFRRGGAKRLVIEAPHGFFDARTDEIGLALFRRTKAVAYATNTVHRYEGKKKPKDGDTPADVAHAEHTFFHAFTQGCARALASEKEHARFVQVHGFAKKGERTDALAIASQGRAAKEDEPAFFATVKKLRDALGGDGTIAIYGREAKVLGATTNVQGRWLRANSTHEFFHIEMNEDLRKRLVSPDERPLLEAFARAFGGD